MEGMNPDMLRKARAISTVVVCKLLGDTMQAHIGQAYVESPSELFDELVPESRQKFQDALRHSFIAHGLFCDVLAENPPPAPPTNGNPPEGEA